MTDTATAVPTVNVSAEDRKVLAGMEQREALSEWFDATVKLQGSIIAWWQAWSRVVTMRSS